MVRGELLVMQPKPSKRKKKKPSMKAVFAQVWASRPHVCSNCGYPISQPIAHVFAHVHGKNTRPDLKYNPEYIRLLCSTWIRQDGEVGCHESSHTDLKVYKKRALSKSLAEKTPPQTAQK